MTVPAQRSWRASNRTGTALRVLLAVALLAPVGMLFSSTWRSIDERRSVAERERHGVEYLRSLGPVTLALVDAQSGAVAGRVAAAAALRTAVEQTSAVDLRYGAELRTSERWAGIRAKIEALPDRPTANPEAAWTAYVETTDLLLALYAKVRDSSGLIRDPVPDSYQLQDAVAEELPEALIAAGRLADRTVLAASRPAPDRLGTASELALSRAAVLDPATDLLNDLRSAVESTSSQTLGGNLLSRLDGYQRAVEALAALTGAASTPDPIQVAAARSSAQLAGSGLSMIILTELASLLRDRVDGLTSDRRAAIGALVLAVGLILALGAMPVLAARRAGRAAGRRVDPSGHAALGSGTGAETGAPLTGPPPGESPFPLGAAPTEAATAGGAGMGGAAPFGGSATGSTGTPGLGGSFAGVPAVGVPAGVGVPPLPDRRPLRPDPADEPGRRSPLADWQDPVAAGQATQSSAPETQPAPWGQRDAR